MIIYASWSPYKLQRTLCFSPPHLIRCGWLCERYFHFQTIDSLHIKNHKSARCQEIYHPDNVHKEHPLYNLMCAEQTFVWLSRYKRIMCAMNKTHHLFFLHRIIVHRNSYTQTCHATNRKPLLPKAKAKPKD